MPAIQVARTDTFEQQRNKINEIGTQLFSVTSGGSDLSTGNLKLGDGTVTVPSLAFTNDAELGIYRPDLKTLGFVSAGKNIIDFSNELVLSFKDINIRKKSLTQAGVTVADVGSNYDTGTYTSIALTGGTGDGGTIDVNVLEFVGTVTAEGLNYNPGTYSAIELITSGSGTPPFVDFEVDAIEGDITPGSGYVPGSYSDVPMQGGSGSGATANIVITGTADYPGTITNPGSGYTEGTYPFAQAFNQPRQTFIVTLADGGTPADLSDDDFIIDGVTNGSVTLEIGNTYRFDISNVNLQGHSFFFRDQGGVTGYLPSGFLVQTNGSGGQVGDFIDIIIDPSVSPTTVEYYCMNHSGMEGTINVVTGTTGQYGYGSSYEVVVNASGVVTSCTTAAGGQKYKAGDVLQFTNNQLGGVGSGFLFTLGTPSYNGTVDTVTFTDQGQDYLVADVLTILDGDVGSGGGSNFAFTITSNPGRIKNLTFSTYNTGHAVNDVFTLPGAVTNLSTNLGGQVNGVAGTATAGSPVVTLTSTTGLVAGMQAYTDFGSTGDVGAGTLTIQSVDSPTQITLDGNATTSGALTITFVSPGSTTLISLTSIAGIQFGYLVEQVSGTGILGDNITVLSINDSTNEVELSSSPTQAGTAVLNFIPPFGIGNPAFSYRVDALGVVDEGSVSITDGGTGYNVGDQLSVNPSDLTQPIEYTLTTVSTQVIDFQGTISASTFSVGDSITAVDGAILSATGTGSTVGAEADQTYSNITSYTYSGNGVNAVFEVTRDNAGDIASVTPTSGGSFYAVGETLTIPGTAVGGATPGDDVTVTISGVSQFGSATVYEVNTSGGNISNLLVSAFPFSDGDEIIIVGQTNIFTINTASATKNRFFLNDGNGAVPSPDLTFYAGNKYKIDTADPSNDNQQFSFSQFPGGTRAPSLVENVSSVLDSASAQITVASTTGILAGMQVTETGTGEGQLAAGTLVASVDGPTTISLSALPLVSGNVTLDFSGIEYTDGLIRESSYIELTVSETTPNLYYYDAVDGPENEESGGFIGSEALITIDPNNPKVFGSGFQLSVTQIEITDIITANVETGLLTSQSVQAQSGEIAVFTAGQSITTSSLTSTDIEVSNITNTTGILVNTPALTLRSAIAVENAGGQVLTIDNTNGDLTTSGVLSTTTRLDINGNLEIVDNDISSSTSDILLTPASGRIVKINTISGLIIPVGDTGGRPSGAVVADGCIRFNTDTDQYEGYASTTGQWSSLGGVRDLDGNTYIKAEDSVGANDNTLWFINDGINTVRFRPTKLEFFHNKSIESPVTNAPNYVEWTANAPVSLGDYLKYRNNLYEVTVAGTTATSGNEPTHTSGAAANGSAELTWTQLAVAPLTFREIEELRVGPQGDLPLVINSELRLFDNVVSTDVDDLVLRPNAGKKVIVESATNLVIPVGSTADRGVSVAGSIRYNTTTLTYEGYDGTNWGSLGGVKDVDQNTYIIPETAPGSNENILYFFNDGNNTVRLTTTDLQFDTIDTIVSSTSNEFEITASLMTFDIASTTLDNTAADRTFLHTSKQYFDLGVSAGLVVDPILRLDNQGDVYFNTTFGSGSFTGVKVFDGDLKEFELSDVKILTEKITLTKGTVDNGNITIYDITTQDAAKVTLSARNAITGAKEFIEFGITDNGTDVFHTEYGNITTGTSLIDVDVELTGANQVRINISLSDSVSPTESVIITSVSNVTKR